MIIQGDGSSKNIRDGLCPRCHVGLQGSNAINVRSGWIWSPTHDMSDVKSEETDMHARVKRASSYEIQEESMTESLMEWPQAMSIVEDAIRFKLDYMIDYPHDTSIEADRQRLESVKPNVKRINHER